ncbi:long-chain fatty acid transport protein [Chitinivorax tropicus]|uniref:Long-chain fatty acid transport protein n=1 Tax=Chitinivorax tropicus TaxID=714531 RepID=A0A840MXD0_9PROT|nr:outer membrane protein transport protein [Chitinivorax tropicus]MBB5019811.1 long-chain fatty acid transport protein [Chitinivorax tropicus]
MSIKIKCLCGLLMAWGGAAAAAGFALQEQFAADIGLGFAQGVNATGALAAANNPAGMVALKAKPEWMLAASLIDLQARFRPESSTTHLFDRATGQVGVIDNIAGMPVGELRDVGGSDGGQAGGRGLLPAVAMAWPVAPDWVAGLSVTAPYGAATDFEDGWVGRYTALKTQMSAINLHPSIAWRANDQWSFGAGLNAIRMDAEISKATDFRYEADIAGALLSNTVPVLDGKATMKGKGWGYGVDLGMQYRPTPDSQLGVVWRSAVTPKLTGDYRVDIPPLYTQLASGLGLSLASEVQRAEAKVKLPASLALSWRQGLGATTLFGTYRRTFWSRFDELRIRVDNTPDQVQVEKWRDADMFAIGAQYRYSDALALNAGLTLDRTPVPSAQYRHPSVPDADRTWLTCGLTYQTNGWGRVDVSFAWAKMKKGRVDYTDTAFNRADYPFFNADQHFQVKGDFDLDMKMLAIQYNTTF